MKRWMTALVALGALALPAVAQANTGSVTCDARGVVFTYNANFNVSRTATETVNGVSRTFQVPEHQSVVDIWAGQTGEVTAGATWDGGSIPTTTLTCPAPPPPPAPPTPPVTPPAPPAPPAAPPAPPVAPPAVTTPPTPPATTPGVAVKPPRTPPKCPKGTTRKSYDSKTGVLVCFKILRDHPAKKKHHVKGATATEGDRAKKKQKHGSGGVTG